MNMTDEAYRICSFSKNEDAPDGGPPVAIDRRCIRRALDLLLAISRQRFECYSILDGSDGCVWFSWDNSDQFAEVACYPKAFCIILEDNQGYELIRAYDPTEYGINTCIAVVRQFVEHGIKPIEEKEPVPNMA